MSSYYSQNMGGTAGGGGFYEDQQQQQQQQQQAGGYGHSQGSNYNASQSSQGYNYSSQNMQQWQQKPAQTQQQQQQPANAGAAPFWNPAATAAIASVAAQAATGGLSNETVLDWAMKGGSAAWQSGGASMIPGFDSTMILLRHYFAVDNNYVKRKMLKLIFPFRSRNWKRIETETGPTPEQRKFALPLADENAPDLYIPAMSLITYVLLCALCYGTSGKFNPEVIPDVTFKCFICQVLEVVAIRFGFYMMQAPVPLMDLFGYTGYKYFGLCINMVIGIVMGILQHGTTGFYVSFLWTASAAMYFMLKTMANNIPTTVSAAGPKREVMVLSFAVSQAVTMWFVSQTKFL